MIKYHDYPTMEFIVKPSLKMLDRNYPTLGHCIFCLDRQLPPRKLTKEHIVPDALNGTLRFEEATCEPCAQYGNRTFENPTLQGALLVARLLLNLKRRDKKRPKTLPKVGIPDAGMVDTNAVPLDVDLDPGDYPPQLHLFVFEPPGLLIGENPDGGLRQIQLQIVNLETLLERTPNFPPTVVGRVGFNPHAFALSIAKIAYCFAVAECGLTSFDGASIRAILDGSSQNIFSHVGSTSPPRLAMAGALHVLSWRRQNEFLVVSVCLFASFGAPTFEVVVGRALI